MDRWTRAVNATVLALFVFTVATGGAGVRARRGAPGVHRRGSARGVAARPPRARPGEGAGQPAAASARPGGSRKVMSWTLSVLVVAAIARRAAARDPRVRARAGAPADADPRRSRARERPCCWPRTCCRTGTVPPCRRIDLGRRTALRGAVDGRGRVGAVGCRPGPGAALHRLARGRPMGTARSRSGCSTPCSPSSRRPGGCGCPRWQRSTSTRSPPSRRRPSAL